MTKSKGKTTAAEKLEAVRTKRREIADGLEAKRAELNALNESIIERHRAEVVVNRPYGPEEREADARELQNLKNSIAELELQKEGFERALEDAELPAALEKESELEARHLNVCQRAQAFGDELKDLWNRILRIGEIIQAEKANYDIVAGDLNSVYETTRPSQRKSFAGDSHHSNQFPLLGVPWPYFVTEILRSPAYGIRDCDPREEFLNVTWVPQNVDQTRLDQLEQLHKRVNFNQLEGQPPSDAVVRRRIDERPPEPGPLRFSDERPEIDRMDGIILDEEEVAV
jgi:hypothetical protein